MFDITEKATKQFQASAESVADNSLALRIFAQKNPKEGMIYNMGFDEPKDDDVACTINGVNFIVDPDSVDNVKSMLIDYRDFYGQEQFVFINPNDKKESCETSPSGCDPKDNTSCKSCTEG